MVTQRERLLIFDGYNVLRTGTRYQDIEEPDYTDDIYNAARERLISDVASYMGDSWDAVVVFDAADNPYSEGSTQTFGSVRVVFSASGQSADQVIEKLARDARERGAEVIVVTNDLTIANVACVGGTARMSTDEFCRAMDAHDSETFADTHASPAHKNTIADRLDEDTLAQLKNLRDG